MKSQKHTMYVMVIILLTSLSSCGSMKSQHSCATYNNAGNKSMSEKKYRELYYTRNNKHMRPKHR